MLVQRAYPREMGGQRRFDSEGQHRNTVLIAFALAHHDVVGAQIDVLDPQPQTLREAETSPVYSQCSPSSASSEAFPSCLRDTTGRRRERLARTALSIQPGLRLGT